MNKPLIVISLLLALAGCNSIHLGMGIPIPGPIQPYVGVAVDDSGVKGTGGVGTSVGPVPVHVGGATKPVALVKDEGVEVEKSKAKVKESKAK